MTDQDTGIHVLLCCPVVVLYNSTTHTHTHVLQEAAPKASSEKKKGVKKAEKAARAVFSAYCNMLSCSDCSTSYKLHRYTYISSLACELMIHDTNTWSMVHGYLLAK